MRTSMMALALLACAGAAPAAIVYTGTTYTENFDSLPGVTVAPAPFSATIGLQFPLNAHGVAEWQVAKIAGTGTTAMGLLASEGSSNSGGIHSLGAVGSGERALGLLASGTNVPGMGVEITNGTAFVVTDATITFNREVWRTSTSTLNRMLFSFGTSGGTITSTNFLTDATMTLNPSGDLVGLPFVATNGAIPVDSLAVVVNLTGLSIAPGSSLFLRWTDFNDVGNDSSIGIDDFTLVMTPAPGAAVLMGMGALVAMRRRR